MLRERLGLTSRFCAFVAAFFRKLLRIHFNFVASWWLTDSGHQFPEPTLFFMSDRITQLRADFDHELTSVNTDRDAIALRDRWVGRKSGLLTAEMKTLSKFSPEERKTIGARLNELKGF